MSHQMGLLDGPLPSDTLETWEQYLAHLKTYPPEPLRDSEILVTESIIGKMKARQAKASKSAAKLQQ